MAGYFISNILKRSLTRDSIVQRAAKYSSLSKPYTSYSSSLPKTATPWLMLPPDVNDRPNGPTDNYFNILDRSLVKLDRHQFHGIVPPNTVCLGTTRGWVTFTDDTDDSVYLADPYEKGRSFKLPPFDHANSTGFNCTLAGNPLSESFALLTLQYDFADVGYMYCNNHSELGWQAEERLGNSNALLAYSRKDCTVYNLLWQAEERLGNSNALLAYSSKDCTVYNLQWQEKSALLKINCWDVLGENAPKIVRDFSFTDQVVDGHRLFSSLMSPDLEIRETWIHGMRTYLVVGDCDGSQEEPDLLLIIRHFNVDEDERNPAKTKKIDVISIDLERKKLECVKSIGDRMIFIGGNSDPFILSTRDCPGLTSNSIYIADDLGSYDLETKCVTPFLSLGDLTNTRPQVYWVAPRN